MITYYAYEVTTGNVTTCNAASVNGLFQSRPEAEDYMLPILKTSPEGTKGAIFLIQESRGKIRRLQVADWTQFGPNCQTFVNKVIVQALKDITKVAWQKF